MENLKEENKTKETTRLETFSDGVFAIAITLLVLELIQILHPDSEDGLLMTFAHHWQSFIAFFIGFITILVCWINHHIAFEYINKVDTKLMWVNGFLLFIVTLTPFPTAILAEYLDSEAGISLAIFGFNYILISIAAYSICNHAYHRHLIAEEHRQFYGKYKLIYRHAIFYNLAAFLLCFVSVIIPIILFILLFAAFAAPKEFATRLYKLRIPEKKEK